MKGKEKMGPRWCEIHPRVRIHTHLNSATLPAPTGIPAPSRTPVNITRREPTNARPLGRVAGGKWTEKSGATAAAGALPP
jgi:hypothetical protein